MLLRDPDWRVSNAAANAVGELGAAVATPEILGQLAGWLRDPDSSVRQTAAEALGKLGAAAATCPSAVTANEPPSNTSSFCPPTWLT